MFCHSQSQRLSEKKEFNKHLYIVQTASEHDQRRRALGSNTLLGIFAHSDVSSNAVDLEWWRNWALYMNED
jgi:hypothetical protein